MPSPFSIIAAGEQVDLGANRRGSVAFTVTNRSGRPLRGEARIIPLGATRAEWLSLEGDHLRPFAADASQAFVVRAQVPLEAAAGEYPFQLNVHSEHNPDDDYTEGPTATLSVPEGEVQEKSRWPWIAAAVAAAVVLIAALAWAFWPTQAPVELVTVPQDLIGKSVDEARQQLEELGLTPIVTVERLPDVGTVGRTTPEPGSEVPLDTEVQLHLEVPLPTVVGRPLDEALMRILNAGLLPVVQEVNPTPVRTGGGTGDMVVQHVVQLDRNRMHEIMQMQRGVRLEDARVLTPEIANPSTKRVTGQSPTPSESERVPRDSEVVLTVPR